MRNCSAAAANPQSIWRCGSWLPRRKATGVALPGNDFWLFDSYLLLVNHFDDEGELLEPSVSSDPQELKLCADAFEVVWALAIPHADYQLA